jgi:low affinity Fe/Cu permease
MQARFARFAMWASDLAGSVWIFLGSLLALVAWCIWGVMAGWTENTHLWPMSVLTWLTWIVVVLVQRSQILVQQNQVRQEEAEQRKLDEVIRALDKADNRLIGLEKQPPAG